MPDDPKNLVDVLSNLDKDLRAHPPGAVSYAPRPKVIEHAPVEGNGRAPAVPVGEKTGEALVQYAERAAEFILNTSNEIRSITEQYKLKSQRNMQEVDQIVSQYCEGSEKFANLLRERAQIEAERNIEFTKKLHAAGIKYGDARQIFEDEK